MRFIRLGAALKSESVAPLHAPNQSAPGPGLLEFFRSLPDFRQDPLRHFLRAAMEYGDVVRYRSLWSAYQLSHPDHIQQVLQSNFSNYRKGRDYEILRLSL